jgi:hypothetical protein
MMIVGTPEQCVERLRPYADLGVGDFLLGSMTPVDWRTIELAAGTVAPVLKSAVAAYRSRRYGTTRAPRGGFAQWVSPIRSTKAPPSGPHCSRA